MPLAPGLTARQIRTSRLLTNVHTAGDPDGIPVVLVHGNVSSNRFFDELLLALPAGYYGIAPDLRGYGASEALPIDATALRGKMRTNTSTRAAVMNRPSTSRPQSLRVKADGRLPFFPIW